MEGTIKMKIIASSSVTFLVVLAVSTLILGCEEQELGSGRRIRLIGDENLKLKEQLKICNQHIRKLEEVIAEYENHEQKRGDSEKEMGDMVLKLLQDNDAAVKKIEKLTDENLQLKARITELESALVKSTDQPDVK